MSAAPSLAATLDRIRAFANAMDWRPSRVAREAGLADIATRNMHKGEWSPSSSTIRRLEALIPEDWKAGDPLPAQGGDPLPADTGELA